MTELITYTNIQRFSLYDGPGIRTTVFLKGCMARCPWCANPENMGNIEDGLSEPFIVHNSSPEELFEIIKKDKPFFRNDGGVTFSGGEPLLQMSRIKKLIGLLKQDNINTCVETSMNIPYEAACDAINLFDELFVDVKLLEPKRSYELLGIDVEKYIRNFSEVIRNRREEVICRIPFIKGYIDTLENKNAIIKLFEEYTPKSVEILCGHNLGKNKYVALQRPYSDVFTIEENELKEFKNRIQNIGIEVSVLRI